MSPWWSQAAVVELDHPDPALGQAAGHQAVRGEAAVAGRLDAVHVQDALRLAAEVGQLGDRRLHPERQLELGDPGLDLGVEPVFGEHRVEPVDLLDAPPLAFRGRCRAGW